MENVLKMSKGCGKSSCSSLESSLYKNDTSGIVAKLSVKNPASCIQCLVGELILMHVTYEHDQKQVCSSSRL